MDYSAFLSALAASDIATRVFPAMTQPAVLTQKFSGIQFELNPKRMCALELYLPPPDVAVRGVFESRFDVYCPNLDGAAALCDRGEDPAQLDEEHQRLFFDACGDFIAVAAEDYARARGIQELPAMRHEDSLMLYASAIFQL